MNQTLISLGVVFIGGAIVGGRFKALGVEVPVIKSAQRQLAFAVLGSILIFIGLPPWHKTRLTLTYSGTADILIHQDTDVEHTPNNNYNADRCTNEVGRDPGIHRWCVSRTTLHLRTSPPYRFENASIQCAGATGGCGFINMDDPTLTHPGDPVDPMPNPRVSEDGLNVDGWIENWGMDVLATLTAEKHQLVSAADCGSGSHQDARQTAQWCFMCQVSASSWLLSNGSLRTDRKARFPSASQAPRPSACS